MFISLSNFLSQGREAHSIVSELEGALLVSNNPFAYFMLVAFEAGGLARALLLLSATPLVGLLGWVGWRSQALQVMIFVSMGGLRVGEVKGVAKAVLPKFFLEDLREGAFKAFSGCGGKKYVVTCMPRILVEPFLREYLDVDCVVGTEVRVVGGYCLGVVSPPGVMAGVQRVEALRWAIGKDSKINVGLGGGVGDHPFMLLCQERCLIPATEKPSRLPRKDYPKPLIFHDGRFVARPTPLDCVAIFLWLPLGFFLAVSRLAVGNLLPSYLVLLASAATGFKIRASFPRAQNSRDLRTRGAPHVRTTGTLYVCSHRTLIDPVVVAATLRRPITAVTYSVSVVSEVLSPIRTVRLSRDREKDGEMMRALLREGDLAVCPEGTTCREPYLLRFSPLFAEIAESIVPVAVSADTSMFHGTTVRGYKGLDPFFFLMNPNPSYEVEFLERVPAVAGRPSYDVANHVQGVIARALGFQCTSFTRRDKYMVLAGNDGGRPQGLDGDPLQRLAAGISCNTLLRFYDLIR